MQVCVGFLVLFLTVVCHCSAEYQHTETIPPLEETQDFLFLAAAEEPTHDEPAQPAEATEQQNEEQQSAVVTEKVVAEKVVRKKLVLPDDRQNNIILQHKKGKEKREKKTTQKNNNEKKSPYALAEHEKIEDLTFRQLASPVFFFKKKNGELTILGKYKPEGYFGKNLTFLNDLDKTDRIFFIRHTFDLGVEAKCGPRNDDAQLKVILRNKGSWGNPASIAPTTESTIKFIDAQIGTHRHSLGRHVIWVREAWLKILLNSVFKSEEQTKHYFLLGYYPFKLGHGIALGEAYAVNQGLVGFYTDDVIDQYTPSLLFTGEFIKNYLEYDVYAAILENKSDTRRSNSEPVFFQRFGRRNCPARNFGDVDWLLAARLQAVAFNNDKLGTLEFEPYALYNQVPEQRIEFPADASSKLGTIGLEIDYEYKNFGCSFEFAHNCGRQKVHGWDNNVITVENRNDDGIPVLVNTKVIDTADSKKATDTTAHQAIINSSVEGESQNGQLIGGGLKNANDRFSDPFTTKFRGWMMVGDAGYWLCNKQLQFAIAAGIATGDQNPNFNLENPRAPLPDGQYDGFIGLQEVFTGGDRVESAYFLGQRRIARPLSLPDEAIQRGFIASTISEFTNLVYAGFSTHIKPNWKKNKLYWRGNVMFFWQEEPTRAFDLKTKSPLNRNARNFYGVELNSFFDISPLECFKFYVITAVFLPGPHYDDIIGIPLNKDQLNLLNDTEVSDLGSLPLLSTDPAFFLNAGFEYKF